MANEKNKGQAAPVAAAAVASPENTASPAASENQASNVLAVVNNAAPEAPAVSEGPPEGKRARRAIMLKHFIPNPDWINKNIVANGKGTKAVLGRIFGVCTSTERKTNTLPDGSQSESVVAHGAFEMENYLTGELGSASSVYFPMSYATQIETVFKASPETQVVEVDCDVGLEATGKTIPYEWVVIAYREGEEMATLKRLRSARGRPANAAPRLLAPAAPAQLTTTAA